VKAATWSKQADAIKSIGFDWSRESRFLFEYLSKDVRFARTRIADVHEETVFSV
jgi:hypothetical protein